MASDSTQSPRLDAGDSCLPNKPVEPAPQRRPPTPPFSDADRESATEPFPTLDTDESITNGTIQDTEQATSVISERPAPAVLSLNTQPAPQQTPRSSLDVDIPSSRSQTSPITPPYWNNNLSSPPDSRPALSSRQAASADAAAAAGVRPAQNNSARTSRDFWRPLTSWSASAPSARNSHDLHTHQRSVSSASIDSLMAAGGITLRDNESSGLDDRGNACWARSVTIRDYVIVNGGTTTIGAFVVWNVRVETLSGSHMNICKRYSEFDDLRWRLIRSFPNFEGAVPELPPKSLISKFRPTFLEKRRAGLQYFLNCIMLNPEFSGSPVLKEFLFSRN